MFWSGVSGCRTGVGRQSRIIDPKLRWSDWKWFYRWVHRWIAKFSHSHSSKNIHMRTDFWFSDKFRRAKSFDWALLQFDLYRLTCVVFSLDRWTLQYLLVLYVNWLLSVFLELELHDRDLKIHVGYLRMANSSLRFLQNHNLKNYLWRELHSNMGSKIKCCTLMRHSLVNKTMGCQNDLEMRFELI